MPWFFFGSWKRRWTVIGETKNIQREGETDWIANDSRFGYSRMLNKGRFDFGSTNIMPRDDKHIILSTNRRMYSEETARVSLYEPHDRWSNGSHFLWFHNHHQWNSSPDTVWSRPLRSVHDCDREFALVQATNPVYTVHRDWAVIKVVGYFYRIIGSECREKVMSLSQVRASRHPWSV